MKMINIKENNIIHLVSDPIWLVLGGLSENLEHLAQVTWVLDP